MARILNEIRVDDAYNKFYADVDRDLYDVITLGSKNLLNISKFILYCLERDPGVDVDNNRDAFIQKCNEIGEAYKQLSNEKQIEVNDEAKNGKFRSFDALYRHIMSIANNDAPVEGLTYGPKGLIIIEKNDEYEITATPTYASNTGNFGWTSWCTASDICGRYNGYMYFAQYTFRTYGAYSSDNTGYEGILDRINWCKKTGNCSVLMQVCLKQTNTTYQIEVSQGGLVNVICDENDTELDLEDFMDEVGDTVYDAFCEAINDYLPQLREAVLKYAVSEFEKVKKQEDSLTERALAGNIKIMENLPSFINEHIKGRALKDIYNELKDTYDEETDNYDWVDNMKIYSEIPIGGKYRAFTVYVGGESKRMNDFRFTRDVGIKLCLAYDEDELIGYKAFSGKEMNYDLFLITGTPYFIDKRFSRGRRTSQQYDFYNLQGDIEFSKCVVTPAPYIKLVSDSEIAYETEDHAWGCDYGLYTSNGKNMTLLVWSGENNNYSTIDGVLQLRTSMSERDYNKTNLSISFDGEEKPLEIGLTVLYGRMKAGGREIPNAIVAESFGPAKYCVKMNKKDLELMVSECIKRIGKDLLF